MDRKTYDALVKSVAKWRKNVNVHHPFNAKIGSGECPLCNLFMEGGCNGCPINDVSGNGCVRTPYARAEEAQDLWLDTTIFPWKFGDFGQCKAQWRIAAKREAEFLAALVPAGGPTE